MSLLLQSVVVIFIYMVVLYLIAQMVKNNSIVDIGWGLGFVLVVLSTFILSDNHNPRSIASTVLVVLWGIRLFVHILKRNFGKPEDFRYAKWRQEWGRWLAVRAFFQIFMLQGFFMFIIAYPTVVNNDTSNWQFGVAEGLGILIWSIGFFFEAVGDAQLDSFKKKPENKGHIITSGLWRYTRHPNYFGEAVQWWGIFLLCFSSNCGWLGIASPLIITLLLRFVSGVPMLERKYQNNKEFLEYAKNTPAFFPWFPKQ